MWEFGCEYLLMVGLVDSWLLEAPFCCKLIWWMLQDTFNFFVCSISFIFQMNAVLGRIASTAHELAHYHSGEGKNSSFLKQNFLYLVKCSCWHEILMHFVLCLLFLNVLESSIDDLITIACAFSLKENQDWFILRKDQMTRFVVQVLVLGFQIPYIENLWNEHLPGDLRENKGGEWKSI